MVAARSPGLTVGVPAGSVAAASPTGTTRVRGVATSPVGQNARRVNRPMRRPAASSQFGSVVSQIAPIIGAAIANSNNNRSYGPGYYGPGPAYYGPPPGYYGYGYGGF
jgi:hypothetical protein